jgi:microcystin-dependent protein
VADRRRIYECVLAPIAGAAMVVGTCWKLAGQLFHFDDAHVEMPYLAVNSCICIDGIFPQRP